MIYTFREIKNVTKRPLIRLVYNLIIISVIIFIFSNSVLSVEQSSNASGRVLTLVNGILEKLNSPFLLSVVFVRKAAHFIEYFTLGALLAGDVILFKERSIKYFVYYTFASCLVAMTDETIQYFTNRGSMLLDVCLDLFAAALAVLLVFVFNIKNTKKERC